jgi:sec-independent protein translocase protein TatB
MFDIGFWELFIIFMLLLFVVGPERLPAIAGYLGKWFGKFQRYFFELKDSIQQEAEEPTNQINKLLDDQKSSLDFLQKEINDKKKDDEK